MNATPRLSISLVATLLILLLAASARGNHFHAQDVAAQLQSQTSQLTAEIRGNFRHAQNFPQLVSESQQLYAHSVQVRALTRAQANPRQVQDILRRMDRLVHSLEDRVLMANDFRGRGHFDRHVPQCDTRFARRLLVSIDRTLIDLDRALDFRPVPRGPVFGQPVYDFDDYNLRRQAPLGPAVYSVGRGISVQIGR